MAAKRDPYIILGLDAAGAEVRLLWQKFQSALIQASSGAGKSWLIRRLVEQLYGKIQIIVIDPEGEFATLREKFSFLLAGRDGDVPCTNRTARALILKLLEEEVSAILDVSELSLATGAKQDYIKIVAETLIDAPRELRHPVLIIIDEAHLFATEVGKGEASSTKSLIDLCARGRKRGIVPVFATQRMAKVSKDAISELQNYLIGGTMLDSDVKRAIDNLGIEGANKAQFARQIRLLEAGNFWALGRAISRVPILFKVGGIETSHPALGQHVPPAKAPADIQKLLPSFAGLVEASVDDTMTREEMQAEIESLRERLVETEELNESEIPVLPTPEEMRTQLGPEINAEFESMAREMVIPLWEYAKDLSMRVQEIIADLKRIGNPPRLQLPKFEYMPADDVSVVNVGGPRPRIEELPKRFKAVNTVTSVSKPSGDVEERILSAMGELYALGIAKPQRTFVALLAGYSNVKSPNFQKAMSSLVAAGTLVYPDKKTLSMTNPVKVAPPHSLKDLHQRLKSKLGNAAGRIIDHLAPQRMEPAFRTDVANAIGYTNVKSPNFQQAMSRMVAQGLACYPSKQTIALTDLLFPRGLR